MELRVRPKGKEIEEYIRLMWECHLDWEWSKHPELVKAIKATRADLALLMAHLKLELKDVPGTPSKRVVGKAKAK